MGGLSKLWRVLAKVSADKVVLLVFDVLTLIFAAISPSFTFCPVFLWRNLTELVETKAVRTGTPPEYEMDPD